MGLIANQMVVEMLSHMSEKLKGTCIRNENKSEKKIEDGNGKEQDNESSKGKRI